MYDNKAYQAAYRAAHKVESLAYRRANRLKKRAYDRAYDPVKIRLAIHTVTRRRKDEQERG